jgi:peptide deformylase
MNSKLFYFIILILGLLFIIAISLFYQRNEPMSTLPDYVVINDPNCKNKDILEKPSEPFVFPLSKEDLKIIKTLEAKFDAEENCAGLAAPQIGFSKQAIVFAVLGDEDLKKWRPDLEETMPKTIWLNPTFEPIGDEKHTDYEGCFSVKDLAGPVARYKKIRYTAYLIDGTQVKGEASGFLARVIQHEIEHLQGTLCIKHVPEGQLLSIEEYRRKRAEALEKGR